MASIDSSLVKDEIKRLISLSQSAKKQVRNVFTRLEADPSEFEELQYVSPDVAARFENVTIRKVKITGKNHDYRMIVAHWILSDDSEHVDVLLVFAREQGYAIDWDWVEATLDPPARRED